MLARQVRSSVEKVPTRLVAVAFDAREPRAVARFWAELLERDAVDEHDGVLLPGDDMQVGLRFVAACTQKVGPNRLHLHLASASPEGQRATVEKALSIGGHHLEVGQLPDEEHVVLSDPDGNEFCVIEAGNGFLAGCGPLGEVACDGSRAVGVFWHQVLEWPLVWDQGQETAIQSPDGGTKLAWGGPPVAPKQGRNRQRFDVAVNDLETETARLTSLGATRLADVIEGVEFADPDGNEFRIITA
ncbi:VOC family protein [Fodinibacter luteus]|uniref:VOC family protein n=1 Tax=Fodinibacter luteus TaxID=552064 RepID=A0ABP8K5X9_9MICO